MHLIRAKNINVVGWVEARNLTKNSSVRPDALVIGIKLQGPFEAIKGLRVTLQIHILRMLNNVTLPSNLALLQKDLAYDC